MTPTIYDVTRNCGALSLPKRAMYNWCTNASCTKSACPWSSTISRCLLSMTTSCVSLKVWVYVPVDAGAFLAFFCSTLTRESWRHRSRPLFIPCLYSLLPSFGLYDRFLLKAEGIWIGFPPSKYLQPFSSRLAALLAASYCSQKVFSPEGLFCAVICPPASFDWEESSIYTDPLLSEVSVLCW